MHVQYKKILVALVVGAFFYFVAGLALSSEHSMLIGIIALLVTLWTNE
jgi:sodium-dependent dicarboxylate transporter 2/3/5